MSKYFHRKNSTVTRPCHTGVYATVRDILYRGGAEQKRSVRQAHEGTTVYDTTLEGAWPVANVRQWKIFQHRVILPPISLTLSRLKFAQFFSTFLQRPMKGQMNVGELTQEDERKPMCLRFSTLFFLLVCSRPCPADYAALAPNARQSNSHLSPTCSAAQQPALLILGCWYCNQVPARDHKCKYLPELVVPGN